MAPVSRLANCRPDKVKMGIRALGSAWRNSTARWLKPRARAVRIKSSCNTSSMAERVMRASTAACTTASAKAGSNRLLRARSQACGLLPQPSKPPAENQRKCTANTSTSNKASQKPGTAMPSWLTVITSLSPTRRCCAAANTPAASARQPASSMASRASGRVKANLCVIRWLTGLP